MSNRIARVQVAAGRIFREGKYVDKIEWEKIHPKDPTKATRDRSMILPMNK